MERRNRVIRLGREGGGTRWYGREGREIGSEGRGGGIEGLRVGGNEDEEVECGYCDSMRM